jgi:4-hydroxy-2-oxoheptanedioate aldolase
MQKADPWPLNPNGELLLGVKIEDKYALANVQESLKIPGISIGEGGPSDMALSFGLPVRHPTVKEANDRVFGVAKANKIFWNGINRDDAIDKIKQGYMIGFGPEAAEIGRKYTKRSMPY